MGELCKRFYNQITKDKKSITLLTTLVNINCLAYYIYSRILFNPKVVTSIAFSGQHFIATITLVVVDLWVCWGYIHSCIKRNFLNEQNHTEEVQSALETANFLTELKQGNIVPFGMYSFDYMAKIEPESTKGDEIWCITGDLEEDAKNENLKKIIHENLRNGVVYRYFITRVGESISDEAKWGKQKLLQDHAKYKKRLKFIEIKEELIAPDIDIIIYKANSLSNRIGFVCVEIGDDQDTYIYQQLKQVTLQGIYEKLVAYNSTEKRKVFLSFFQLIHKAISFFVKHLSVAYFLVSTGGLALLSFSKIVSISSAIMFLVPAIIEFLITFALMTAINESDFAYKEALTNALKNESILASIINSFEIQSATEKLKENTLDKLMSQKGLGHAKESLGIDGDCSAIWLLSDLSYDIANPDFYDWLVECMNSYTNLICNIIYTQGTATRGRLDKIKRLENIYINRIKLFSINNISAHYIWSKTHGIIFLENIAKQHDVYISLCSGDNSFYKKVLTTEKEASTLLGRLKNVANI